MTTQRPVVSSISNPVVIALDDDVRLLADILQHKLDWSDVSSEKQRELLQLSHFHQIFPAIYQIAGSPPELEQAAQWYKMHAVALMVNAQAINKLLVANGIQVRWIKGIALAYLVYDKPWLRSMRDIDFIVPMDQRLQALSILTENGYTYSQLKLKSRVISPELSHFVTHHFHLRRDGIHFELHYDFGASKYLDYTPEDLDALWETGYPMGEPDNILYTFVPEVHIILMALHDIFQHQGREKKDFRLHRTYDLWLMLNQYKIDWSIVAGYAQQFHCHEFVTQALKQAASLFDLPFDLPDVIDFLHEYKRLQAGVELHKRTKAVSRALPPLYLMRYFLPNKIVLPPEKMRLKYGVDDNAPIWQYYIRELPHSVSKLSQYLWQWLRGR